MRDGVFENHLYEGYPNVLVKPSPTVIIFTLLLFRSAGSARIVVKISLLSISSNLNVVCQIQ